VQPLAATPPFTAENAEFAEIKKQNRKKLSVLCELCGKKITSSNDVQQFGDKERASIKC
jgi:hypothetical protein